MVASAEGRVQILDLKEVGRGSVFQVTPVWFTYFTWRSTNHSHFSQIDTTSFLTSMAIAPTGEGLAFGDAEGYVHLWSSQEDAKFCRFEGEVEMPDTAAPLERIDWHDDT